MYMQDPDKEQSEDATDRLETRIVALKAARFPLWIPAWELWAFFLAFMAFGMIGNLLPRWSGTTALIGLLAGVTAAILVGVWRRSGRVAAIEFSAEGARCKGRSGHSFFIPAETMTLVAVEGVVDLSDIGFQRWGRLRVVAGKARLNLLWDPVGAKQTFEEILSLYPHVLGISGDSEITPPAIDGVIALDPWLVRLRQECRQEFGRQIGFAAFFAFLLTVSALDFFLVYLRNAGSLHSFFQLDFYSILILALLGGAAGFGASALRRWGLLQQVEKNIDSVSTRERNPGSE